MDYDKAKEMYLDYGCSEYNMRVDGVLTEYTSYNVPLEMQKQWKQEFINSEYSKLLSKKDLYSLNILSSFSKGAVETDILLSLYKVYENAKKSNDMLFLAKMCCGLINSVNLFHIKKDPVFITKLIDDVMGTINEIQQQLDSDNYICKIFEEQKVVEQTKKLLFRYKEAALKIKGKIL